jgi:hypothetical protein
MQRVEVVKTLIKAGASLASTNSVGDTPADLGIKCGIPQQKLDAMFGMYQSHNP